MSTPQGAANDAPQKPEPGAEGTNVFTKKLGPLPLWAWMGIGLAIALGFYFWRQNSGKGASASDTTPPDQTTEASQIPQFVNQTFVQGEPPATPTTPTSPVGTKPPTNEPPAHTFFITTNGKESLATIAKKQGVSVENIAKNTDQLGGASNHGKFWKWYSGSSKHGTKGHVPAGIKLFFQSPTSPNKYAQPVTSASAS